MHCPVTPEERELASQRVVPATSDWLTFLRRGAFAWTWSRILSKPGMPDAAIVRIGPEEMLLTRWPCGPRWQASSILDDINYSKDKVT